MSSFLIAAISLVVLFCVFYLLVSFIDLLFSALGGVAQVAVALIMIVVFVFIVAGCATKPPEQLEWEQAMDRENWAVCQARYRDAGRYTVSRHHHDKHREHRPHEVKEDLFDNHCRLILGEEWAE